MSGMTHYGSRKGDKVYVSLFGRGGWPTAERAARTLIRTDETLIREDDTYGLYTFTVEPT